MLWRRPSTLAALQRVFFSRACSLSSSPATCPPPHLPLSLPLLPPFSLVRPKHWGQHQETKSEIEAREAIEQAREAVELQRAEEEYAAQQAMEQKRVAKEEEQRKWQADEERLEKQADRQKAEKEAARKKKEEEEEEEARHKADLKPAADPLGLG